MPVPRATRARWLVLGLVVGLAGAIGVGTALVLWGGVSARPEPSALEARIARAARHWAIPAADRVRVNPIPPSDAVIALGRDHWADHCATCHGNDGSGDTPIGRGLSPRAPDMRLSATQELSDGELYYIIVNGVRLTGMPAWGDPSAGDDPSTWHLVRFIRHLPKVTSQEAADMAELNPKTRAEIADEEENRKFLEGDDAEDEPGSDRQAPAAPAP